MNKILFQFNFVGYRICYSLCHTLFTFTQLNVLLFAFCGDLILKHHVTNRLKR